MDRLLAFLKSLGELNPYRLDTVLMRIRERPLLVVPLNLYLLSISATVRAYHALRRQLAARGWVPQPMLDAASIAELPSDITAADSSEAAAGAA